MKRKFKFAFILAIVFGVIGFALGIGISVAMGNVVKDAVFNSQAPFSLIGLAVGVLAGIIMGLMTKKKKPTGSNLGTTTEGEETDIAYDSKFISPDEMKTDRELIHTTWKSLPSLNKTGFVFRMKQSSGAYEVNMKPETHALVLGTTGVGKTQLLANPTIRILAHSGQKPSMVVTDPKGELYEDNAAILKEEGYEIVVLNLNDPYASSMWNPMEIAYRAYERAGNLAKEVKKYTNVSPEDAGFTRFSSEILNGVEYGESWYGFEGKAFPSKQLLEQELEAKKIQLEDEAKSDLRNIALSLIPDDPNSKDPTWSNGCRLLKVEPSGRWTARPYLKAVSHPAPRR